jgi:hypothetical protein
VLLARARRDVITVLYSVPARRTKRLGIWANLTIAIPRGVLLKVAGWSSVKTIVGPSRGTSAPSSALPARRVDDQGLRGHGGDARGGCRTLPIIYGVRRAAWMISPSFVVPVPDDRDRSLDGRPHRQLHPAAGARA